MYRFQQPCVRMCMCVCLMLVLMDVLMAVLMVVLMAAFVFCVASRAQRSERHNPPFPNLCSLKKTITLPKPNQPTLTHPEGMLGHKVERRRRRAVAAARAEPLLRIDKGLVLGKHVVLQVYAEGQQLVGDGLDGYFMRGGPHVARDACIARRAEEVCFECGVVVLVLVLVLLLLLLLLLLWLWLLLKLVLASVCVLMCVV